jgi:hypothetical protein
VTTESAAPRADPLGNRPERAVFRRRRRLRSEFLGRDRRGGRLFACQLRAATGDLARGWPGLARLRHLQGCRRPGARRCAAVADAEDGRKLVSGRADQASALYQLGLDVREPFPQPSDASFTHEKQQL